MDPLLIGVVVLVFLTVGGLGLAFLNFSKPKRTAGDRLSEFTASNDDEKRLIARPVDEDEGVAIKVAGNLSKLASPQSEEDISLMRKQLIQAGYRSPYALEIFNGSRVAAALFLPLLATPLIGSLPLVQLALGVLALAAAGYYVPQLMVTNALNKRQQALMVPFADALDMLVASVEAGLGLDAAFRRVANELEEAAPELAREFQQVNYEVNAGVPRIEALQRLSERTGLDEVRSLVNMLTQAERFGTSIARSLRVHADVVRQQRMSRAEEEAAKISPKLTVVMIIFMLPCLVVVLLGPAAINIRNNLLPTLD